jgi:hypothetical protein
MNALHEYVVNEVRTVSASWFQETVGAGVPSPVAVVLFTALTVWLPAAQSQELGRLFLTPQQRQSLEQLRNAPPAPPQVVEVPPPVVESNLPPPVEQLPQEEILPAAPPPNVPPITVNGLVLRSNGQSTAWVNGQNTIEGDFSFQHIRVGRPSGRAVPIVTPEHLPDVRLKPGQTYDPTTNTIVDIYQDVQ